MEECGSSSVTEGEEVVVLWNKSEMQWSAFIAILEPQSICLSSLFFLLPSGSERDPSCFHFLDVLFSPGYQLELHQFALLKQETTMERSCVH